MQAYKIYINGEWVDSSDGDTFEVHNPANGQLLAYVAKGTRQDVRSAIDAARDAFDSEAWSGKTPAERSNVLWKLAELVEKNQLQLATLESKNVGKTIKYARNSDMPFIIDNLRFFAGAARMLTGLAASEYADSGTSFLRREPVGVVGAIISWNYPLYIAIWKLAPALAAGNTLVIKPASYTPLSLLEFAKLIEKAGIPKGVFNVVTGSGEVTGAAIAGSRDIDMICLTGSITTGRNIMKNAADSIKKVHLELGGKAPLIVMPDADMDMAVKGAVVGAFWNAGQDCTAVTRVYVHKKQEAKLVRLMLGEITKIRLGDPLDQNTDLGPLISSAQRDRVSNYIKTGIDEGAELIYGGELPKGKRFENGYYLVPALFRKVKQHMKLCREEIFGPVLSVLTYDTIGEAVKKANDVEYGLAASVYGKDIIAATKIANRLRFGTVWINEHGILASEMPHGGFRQSGFGKDLSIYSMEEYTNLKHIYIDQTGLARKPWHYTVYGKR